MAILTYPLNGIDYDAEDAEVYMCTRTSGVFAAEGHFPASVSGRTVSIGPGLAWMQNQEFHGKAVYNPEAVDLDIAEADAYQDRIDRIVLRFDKLLNQTTLEVEKGTASNNPVAPDIERDDLIYELGLYTVRVPASTISVSEGNIESTMLDENVCGIMEDAVTGIPTQELYDEWHAFFADIQSNTETFEAQLNAWFANIQSTTDDQLKANQDEFNTWMNDTEKDFDEWFENVKDVLDTDTAGKLQNEIDAVDEKADSAIEMLMTGTAQGFLLDGEGNAILMSDNTGLVLEWEICNCKTDTEMIDMIYPVGSVYMSANETSPEILFGGEWTQFKDTFLLAAGDAHEAGAVGGSEYVTLAENNLPEHTHSIPELTGTAASNGAHTHTGPSHTHSIPALSGTAASAGSHTHSMLATSELATGGSRYHYTSSGSTTASGMINSAGAHTHSVTTNASTTGSSGTGNTGSAGAHTHTVTTTASTSGATGSGEPFSTMPPYMTVYMWQRVA